MQSFIVQISKRCDIRQPKPILQIFLYTSVDCPTTEIWLKLFVKLQVKKSSTLKHEKKEVQQLMCFLMSSVMIIGSSLMDLLFYINIENEAPGIPMVSHLVPMKNCTVHDVTPAMTHTMFCINGPLTSLRHPT